jgi:hypothetical protein
MGNVEVARYSHDDIYPPKSPGKMRCFVAPGRDAYKDYHVDYSSESNRDCSWLKISLRSYQLVIVNTYLGRRPAQDVATLKTRFL